MSWLNFIILNSVAPIENLHQISDAGAGAGLMQLHPTRDSELIACGKANTLVNGQYLPSPVTSNGLLSPAMLVHGILIELQKRGFKIRLHCYQLGLQEMPDFSNSKLDDVVVHHCLLGDEAILIKDKLLPELQRQAQCQEQHLIAESGIGGTTYATLWLRRWLNRELSFAGSTKNVEKLKIKQQLINMLLDETADLPVNVADYLANTRYSDPIQRACCTLLSAPLESLNLAGGTMIFAPIIAMNGEIKVKKLSVATTRWTLDFPDAQLVAQGLPDNCLLETPETEFHQSQFAAIRMYEQGYIIEGCALGASLNFAEAHGIKGSALINSLDKAVAPWFE